MSSAQRTRVARLETSLHAHHVDRDTEATEFGSLVWEADGQRCYRKVVGGDSHLTVTDGGHATSYVVVGGGPFLAGAA